MLPESIQKYLNRFLSEKFALKISSLQIHSIGGGCINETYQVQFTSKILFFLKINSVTKYPDLFKREKSALECIGRQQIILVPSVIAFEEVDNYQVMLLEWIQNGTRTEQFWKRFGEKLAALHQISWSNKNVESLFGYEEDNYIGSLPQINTRKNSWIDFFVHLRLQPQIDIARNKHLLQKKHFIAFESLYPKLHNIFNREKSSLLHGDLWNGNFMCNEHSEPVLIDPAIYFGHRSMDLAMTTLFGGFDRQFYDSYNFHFAFPENYAEQWEICNLYPLLIHLNLFGPGYLAQIESILRRFA